ncbi:cytochrome P450 306a1 [Cydia pomonella]|uniref:cytochrome P450 306a1 n=1 Tax=Cydia pomonella TaxID=82600 RepID=UPI002ADD32A9|nr:cytochrome P450 306a1 [Cydia pomonella]XP_061712130.1 cytochrome P450 306a1 [Cydia pomonella]XP_061712131.1 cytochrome P450 306a1 [Cydia pomonella]XP_061712132.1 cytochrome P450 306a1 [Cydia pomonella]
MDFFFVWLCTFVVGFWISKKIKEWRSLPPGPWGLPVVGYLPFIDRNHPHLTLTKLSRQYGPIYGIGMGSIYAVVLSDHKLIREAFAKDAFSGRAPLFLTHGIMHGNGIICAEGQLWKDQRKLVTTWLKSYGMSKHSASREKLEKRIASGVYELLDNVAKSAGSPMDLSHMVSNSLGNVVNEIVFGFKFPPEDKTWHWLRQIQEEGCYEMGVSGVVNFLPFMRFFSSSIRKTMETLTRGQAQTHRFYASIISRRRKMLGLVTPPGAEYPPHADLHSEHPDGYIKCVTYSKHVDQAEEHFFNPETLIATEGDCILDSFLEEQKKRFESGDNSAAFVRDEQLYYLSADMFGAGLDTTSVTLAWFLLYMALYPEEQERIRTEILNVYPEEDQVDSTRLPLLMAAICETQRIRSIVPVGIPHGCLQDTMLGGYKVPKGAMVIPLQWAMHMDPEAWKDPEEFKPSRFISHDGSLLKPQEFIPFQTGKRMCPGDELSRMISCGLVAKLFRRSRLRLASDPPSEEDMKGKVGLTLTPPPVLFYCDTL